MEKQNRLSRYVLRGVLLTGIILLAFLIRIQGVAHLSAEQFTEHDAYLYYYQAGTIAEQGTLPARDMHRWLPIGRNNAQLLSLYSYAIAYIHKALPWLSLYHIQLYLPTVSFIIGLVALFLFLARAYGVLFATIVGVLLATLPGSIERSAAGFGDRDAWCWMLATLVVTTYLWKGQIPYNLSERAGGGAKNWCRYFTTALSGFIAFLGGLSWEAFGTFLLIIHAVELWKFCATDREHHLKEYFLWMFMFVPWLFLISPVYRNGYGFSTHVTALMLAPPLVIFTLRGIRYLLLHFYQPLHPHARKLAWFLTLFAITAGIGFFLLQFHTFETTAFALRESKLMKSIGELKDPNFTYWMDRYGTVFIFSSLGLIVTGLNLWKWKSLPLTSSLVLFVTTTFFRDFIDRWTTSKTCDTLFFISLLLTLLSLGYIVYLQRETVKNEWVKLAMLAWFLLWVGLSRGGKRYDFFIGVPLAFFTAQLIYFIVNIFSESVKPNEQHLLKTGIAVIILAGLMFFPPFGAYTQNSIYAATEMRKAVPGNKYLTTAFHWMKTNLPENTVVAAAWSYGTQLNVFGGVKTIVDPDHYIPYWLELYKRYVYYATSEREFLEFLKTHGATHLMLTYKELITHSLLGKQNSKVLVPVYPRENFSKARVKIWEIHYPPDIESDPRYLTTEPEE